ncbi:hypothetical protein [Wolbachia endosymbiont of Litomosoides brasiliensis]|uniref:hypothetical protein n=1 Tax=Wolbachia endosymbiont of Litomosoides brasiliensis TaxID=1812117 RepID=UPI003978AB6E
MTVLYSRVFVYKTVIDSMKGEFKKNSRYKDWFDFFSSKSMSALLYKDIVDECCKMIRKNGRSRMLEFI